MYNIHLLPASFGDSVLLEWGENSNPHYILIDGGPYFNFKNLYPAIKRVAPDLKEIELLAVTHIDIDHIDGIVTLLNGDALPFKIKEVWFNGWEQIKEFEGEMLGAVQGEYLSHIIQQKTLVHNKQFGGKAVVVEDYTDLPKFKIKDMELQLLSPGVAALQNLVPVWRKEVMEKLGDIESIEEELAADKRYDDLEEVWEEKDILGGENIEDMMEAEVAGDTSQANGSSIAFIATYKGKRCLLSGDATSDYLLEAIDPLLKSNAREKLSLDAWKLAHHGSKKSTLDKLMQKIDCKQLLISSDGKRYKHPDKICISKLLKHNGPDLHLYFNYRTEFNEMWDDEILQDTYGYIAHYPNNNSKPGISLSL